MDARTRELIRQRSRYGNVLLAGIATIAALIFAAAIVVFG